MKKVAASICLFLIVLTLIGCTPAGTGTSSISDTTKPVQSSTSTTVMTTTAKTTTPATSSLPLILTPVPEAYTKIPYTEIVEDLILFAPKKEYSQTHSESVEKVIIPFLEPVDRAQVVGISENLEVYIALENGEPESERKIQVVSWSIPTETWSNLLDITVPAGRNCYVDLVSEKYIVWVTSETRGLEQMEPEICVYHRHTEDMHRFELPKFEDQDFPGEQISFAPTSRLIELNDALYFEMITGKVSGVGFNRSIGRYDVLEKVVSVYQEHASNPFRIEDRIGWCELPENGKGTVLSIQDEKGAWSELSDIGVSEARVSVGGDVALINDSIQSWQIESSGATCISNDGVDGRGVRMIRDGAVVPILASRNAAYVLSPETDGNIVVFTLNGCTAKPLYYDISQETIIELDNAVNGVYEPFITGQYVVYVQQYQNDTPSTCINLWYAPIA